MIKKDVCRWFGFPSSFETWLTTANIIHYHLMLINVNATV